MRSKRGSSGRLDLTAKERILLYLSEHTPRGDSTEAPWALTREGVARASSIATRHVAQYTRPLVREGLVRERQEHVKGIRQRRKVYELTEAGSRTAVRLRQSLGTEVVRVSDGTGVRETTVTQALEDLGGAVPLSSLVALASEGGPVDLETLQRRAQTPFVEMMTEAPRVEGFTGRREELRSIVEESGRHQIYVIQGVAGIGKSSLAAKVCELQRGKRNIFWHKVRSWDTDQTMFTALAEFFRALDRPALDSVMKRGDAARAAEIVREDLPGTHSLLVFDDVHEADRGVLSFLSLCKDIIADAPDARVLVLTRRKVPFYDSRDTALTGIVREITLGGLNPDEVAAMLGGRNAAPELLRASRRLHGHPLLCQLLLTAGPRAVPARLPRDVHRFIEEHVYTGLTPEEATAMKILSLYVVPVPRTAVLSHPGTTAEAFHGLVSRFLVRPVGDEAFEVHDTVREFFADVLSPRDRKKLGVFAVEQLQGLASSSRARADFAGCARYLSNALSLSTSPAQQAALQETLGDAYERLGDLAGALIAFRMSAKAAPGREAPIRLRRKCAQALFQHGELLASSAEIDAAMRAIGDEESVDRGWLHLVRCRIAVEREDFDEAEVCGQKALATFTRFALLQGQARACLELGRIDFLRGSPTVVDSSNLRRALDLATRLQDPELIANVQLVMADLASVRFGDAHQALEHFAAIEAMSSALGDPSFACRFHWTRGWTRIAVLNDRPGAIEDSTEALRVARRLHDVASVSMAHFVLATVHLICARFAEAVSAYEEAAALFQAQGVGGMESNARWLQAECSLFQGDLVGFRRALALFDQLEATKEASKRASSAGASSEAPGVQLALHGFDHLLRGDSGRAFDAFQEAVRRSEENLQLKALMSDVGLPTVLVWFGMAVRATGDEEKGNELFSRGLEMFRSQHLEGARSLFGSEAIGSVHRFLRESWLDSTRGSGLRPPGPSAAAKPPRT